MCRSESGLRSTTQMPSRRFWGLVTPKANRSSRNDDQASDGHPVTSGPIDELSSARRADVFAVEARVTHGISCVLQSPSLSVFSCFLRLGCQLLPALLHSVLRGNISTTRLLSLPLSSAFVQAPLSVFKLSLVLLHETTLLDLDLLRVHHGVRLHIGEVLFAILVRPFVDLAERGGGEERRQEEYTGLGFQFFSPLRVKVATVELILHSLKRC